MRAETVGGERRDGMPGVISMCPSGLPLATEVIVKHEPPRTVNLKSENLARSRAANAQSRGIPEPFLLTLNLGPCVVVDAGVAVKWVLEEPRTSEATALLAEREGGGIGILTPALLPASGGSVPGPPEGDPPARTRRPSRSAHR